MQNARLKPMQVTKANLCRYLVFQMSIQNIQGQKSYRNCLGDGSELLAQYILVKSNFAVLLSLVINLLALFQLILFCMTERYHSNLLVCILYLTCLTQLKTWYAVK